jgi:hemerythrin
MNILQFSEKLTSGIEIIDKQHCELIRLINQLENIPVHNIKLNQLMELLNNIKRVGKQHFCDEERIMENKNFPDCNFHKVQHEKFINIFTDLINVLTTQSDFQSDLKRNLKNIKKIVNL